MEHSMNQSEERHPSCSQLTHYLLVNENFGDKRSRRDEREARRDLKKGLVAAAIQTGPSVSILPILPFYLMNVSADRLGLCV